MFQRYHLLQVHKLFPGNAAIIPSERQVGSNGNFPFSHGHIEACVLILPITASPLCSKYCARIFSGEKGMQDTFLLIWIKRYLYAKGTPIWEPVIGSLGVAQRTRGDFQGGQKKATQERSGSADVTWPLVGFL